MQKEIVGRYKLTNGTVKDIVFNPPSINIRNRNGEFESIIDPKLQEYLIGNSGFYGIWTYDLKSSKISKLTMEWIDELPLDKRDRRSVVRHLMSKMSSENSDNALMVGKWSGLYTEDGRPPTHWINSSSIFDQRIKTGKPVRYGQCWCFAECMTSMLRYLNIPCRTVCGKNIMIDENLDNGVDFKQDLRKDDNYSNTLIHLNKDYIDEMFTNLLNEQGSKSEWENLRIYDCGDSTWNVHYWNEVWIDDHWEAIDSTPVLESEVLNEPLGDNSKRKKILGPSSLLDKKDDSVDFDRFFAMVNSPFRLWSSETITENDKLVDIPYVYSIIFPHSKSKSVYLKLPRLNDLFDKGPSVYMKSSYHDVDITNHYRASETILETNYLSKFYDSCKKDTYMYLQTVYLDYNGNVIKVDRFRGTIEEQRYREKTYVLGCYLTSCLAIEIIDQEEQNKRRPKFIAFCSYYN